MAVFVRLAHEKYGLNYMTKEHICSFNLYDCLGIGREIVDDLICLTLDDEHTLQTPPMKDAPEVLTELAQYGPLRFVTARIWPESIIEWLRMNLPEVAAEDIRVVATGSPEAKLQTLQELRVRCFIEDRVETCKLLASKGIQALLFDQPWNRGPHDNEFPRIKSWVHLRQWLLPPKTAE